MRDRDEERVEERDEREERSRGWGSADPHP